MIQTIYYQRGAPDPVLENNLTGDPALVEVQKIVRGADTGKLDLTPFSAALEMIATGFRLSCMDDYEIHEKEFPMYDAMYAYFKKKSGQ